MPLTDLKNILIEKINELQPDIDTSVGSNFRDLVINPLSTIFEDYQADHDKLVKTLSLEKPENLPEADLDAVGNKFLVTREEGSFATGSITLQYTEPKALTIPKGSRFIKEDTGAEYETIRNFTTTRLDMELNFSDDGLYSTGDIEVRSTKRTLNSNLNSGVLLKSVNVTSPRPDRVLVSSDIVGAAGREDNASFYTRIKNSVKNSSLASTEVIEGLVKQELAAILAAEAIGSGHALMERDLVEQSALTSKTIDNFLFVTNSIEDEGYSKGHVAFINSFAFPPTYESGDPLPWPESPNIWSKRFTDTQYKAIYKYDDALTATDNHYEIIEASDSFSSDVYSTFLRNDARHKALDLLYPNEIRLTEGSVLMGLDPTENENLFDIRWSVEDLKNFGIDIEDGIKTKDLKHLDSVLAEINALKAPENFANLAPVFHTPISQHTGVSVETRMATTDATENGQMAYVTVLRNDTIYIPFDGYGLAWRKQPGFLIRLNYDNYGDDEALKSQDIETFIDKFGVDPVEENLIGNEVLSDPANSDYWMFNVYLVDNNILQEEINLGYNKILDQMSGQNQFLQMGKFWIEPEIDYDFKLSITTALATKAWIKAADTAEYGSEILNKGATYPEYVPSAGTKITSENSAIEELDATRGHFGIGVNNTRGYEWTVSSLKVESIVKSLPMHLFQFKVDSDKWLNTTTFSADYYGVGYDPDLFAVEDSESTPPSTQTEAVIWNNTTEEWESLGSHTANIEDPRDSQKISKEFSVEDMTDYLDNDNYLYIATSPANFGPGFEDNLKSKLESYYVELKNPLAGQKHLNNAIDVFCHVPDHVVEKNSSRLTIASGEITFDDPYVQDIIEIREANTLTSFTASTYKIFNEERGEAFSADNSYKIAFTDGDNLNGAEVIVYYRGWNTGGVINGFLNSAENRYPGITIKEKIMPPAVVYIDGLEYTGEVSETEVRDRLKSFINNLGLSDLTKSDIVNEVLAAGATFVDLDMDIRVKQYTTKFTYVEHTLDQRYSLPANSISRFYASSTTLSGVLNV